MKSTTFVHSLGKYVAYIMAEAGDDEEVLFTKEHFLHMVIDALDGIDSVYCVICAANTSEVDGIGEYYMVHDSIWGRYGVPKGMLCIGCLEERLGRQLVPDDFTDAPINKDVSDSSIRLKNRLGYVPG